MEQCPMQSVPQKKPPACTPAPMIRKDRTSSYFNIRNAYGTTIATSEFYLKPE